MKNHIKPPRLSTSFSRSGAKARDRFANILDTRSKKRGIIAVMLVTASLFAVGGCFSAKSIREDPDTDGVSIAAVGKDSSGQRNDIILLAHMTDGALNITQIPRDTIAGYNGSAKIGQMPETHQILPAIEEVTGVKCDKYIIVNYGGFREIVDAVGGIDFNVPVDMRYSDPSQGLEIDLKAGEQHLNGEQAEGLIRYRKSNVMEDGTFSGYENGDLDRLIVQSGVYKAIGDKLRASGAAAKLPGILKNNTETNLTVSDFANIITEAVKLNPENIKIETLPGEYNDNGEYICEKRKSEEATGLPSIYGEDDTVGYTAKIKSARVNGKDYDIGGGDGWMSMYNKRLDTAFVQCSGNFGGDKMLYVKGVMTGKEGDLEISECPVEKAGESQTALSAVTVSAGYNDFPEKGGELIIEGTDSDTLITVEINYDEAHNTKKYYDAKITSARVNGTAYKITDEDYSTVVYDPRLKKYNVSVYGGTGGGYIAAAGEVSGTPMQPIDVKMIKDGDPVFSSHATVSAIDTDGGGVSILDSKSDTRIDMMLTPR